MVGGIILIFVCALVALICALVATVEESEEARGWFIIAGGVCAVGASVILGFTSYEAGATNPGDQSRLEEGLYSVEMNTKINGKNYAVLVNGKDEVLFYELTDPLPSGHGYVKIKRDRTGKMSAEVVEIPKPENPEAK